MSADASATRTSGTTRSTGSLPAQATGERSPPGSSPTPLWQHVGARQPGPQLLLETCGDRVPTAGQCSDHDSVAGVELGDHASRHMAQPPCHSVPLYRRSHRLPHYQPDSRTGFALLVTPLRVHDDVSFDGPNSVLHRRTEFRRPGHPVPRRQHSRIPPGSGSQRPPALAPTVRHDGSPGAGPHPKPKPVYSRSFAVVWLVGSLALGHDSYLLVLLAPRPLAQRLTTHVEADVVAVGKPFVSLANRRGPRGTSPPVRCRIADFRATVRGY